MCDIVVIDDSPTMLAVVSHMLHDYSIETFSNSDEALQYLSLHNPSILLIDFHLDDKTAFEILGNLDEKRTAIVLMTGADLTDDESKKCRVLQKPFSKAQLRAEVDIALSRHKKKGRPH